MKLKVGDIILDYSGYFHKVKSITSVIKAVGLGANGRALKENGHITTWSLKGNFIVDGSGESIFDILTVVKIFN